ncbi:MAG TPA: CoA transferase [Gammaproteobacteria bacterium]|nr:CoA transferase [Gammaproteobacteria bacterium]
MTMPFEGLRVVDLSDNLSGAFAARLFADFGAEVVLAEPPQGHGLRREPPFLDDQPGPERSVQHAYLNWNKSSQVFSDTEQLTGLVAVADVLVTTLDPLAPLQRVIDCLPGSAVHLSITPHGLANPLSGRPGNNLTISARTGWSFINRYKDEPPLQMPRNQSGYVAGVAGFTAAAAALRRRDHGAVAERVDVSELEAFALTVHPWGIAAIYANRGFSNGPTGARPRGAAGPLWNLSDGQMNFGIADFRSWTKAMQAVGLPEFAHHDDLVEDLGRHSRDLRSVSTGMARSLSKLKRWPVFHQLARLRCVIGVLQNIEDIVTNEQNSARDFLVDTLIENRSVRAAGAPAKLSPSPWRLRQPAPQLHSGGRAFHWQQQDKPGYKRPPSTDPCQEALAKGPLAGLRVLSFGQAWSGTFAAELLALLGADVVQVAALHRPDVWRRVSNEVPAGLRDAGRVQHPLNTQGLYNSVNLNKREITLDLSQPRGREILWELLPRFDILLDNFRPTVLPSWGITLEKLHALRPGMIWASISGYGETGPYSDYPANGATTEPMAGLSSLHGYEGDTGMNTGGLYPDPIAGYFLIATVMAALAHRDNSGQAQRVDLSMMEAITAVCGEALLERDATGHLPVPRGNHHPRVSPHNNYQARDNEWLAIATESEAAWNALVAYTGESKLLAARFASMALRKANEPELDGILSQWVALQDARGTEKALAALGVTSSRVVPLYELYSEPYAPFRESGFVSLVDHPQAGKTWLPGRPWQFSAAPSSPLTAAPCVGQHSREVLAEELGIGEQAYALLVASGITGDLAGQ